MKNKFNQYDYLSLIGLIVWLGGTWYFGWNEEAISVGEKITDSIGTIFIIYGFLNSLVRGIKTEVNLIYSGDIAVK